MSDTDTILGFIPKNKYVQITYWLLLAGAAGGLALSLLALIGMIVPLGGIFTLCGLAGLVLALAGFFLFKPDFATLDQSHLMYMLIVFAVFFVIGMIVGSSFFAMPTMMYAVSVLIGAADLLMVWTGYNSWSHGRIITKDNIKSEVQQAIKRS